MDGTWYGASALNVTLRSFLIHPMGGHSVLVSESLSALGASSLEHLSAVGSAHSFSEAVLLAALTLLGLVGSEHGYTSYV